MRHVLRFSSRQERRCFQVGLYPIRTSRLAANQIVEGIGSPSSRTYFDSASLLETVTSRRSLYRRVTSSAGTELVNC